MTTTTAGIARTDLTPFWGVELTGWGYYIERTWKQIRDRLNATALVVDDGQRTVCLLAVDLMLVGAEFTHEVRQRINKETGIAPEAILVAASHSHNAPASGGLLGVGEVDPVYESWACRQAATAGILAWQRRVPVRLSAAHTELPGVSFNRTRQNGIVDTRVTTLRIDQASGAPLAVVVGFQAHPTVHTILRPFDVTRDVPGEVCDSIEKALPGATAMYVQGACGDCNFLREFSTRERCHEPAQLVAKAALDCLKHAPSMKNATVAGASTLASIPTRRWRRDEIDHDRAEADRRLSANDTANWEETIGRSMTNNPKDMIARHGGDVLKAVRAMCRFHVEWTDRIRRDLDSRPESLQTEVQALRIGDLSIAANSSELFSPFALDLRQRHGGELMVACYSNGRIGYMPDPHDIERKTYAGYQSPKYCNQFPFTDASGPALVDAMHAMVQTCASAS